MKKGPLSRTDLRRLIRQATKICTARGKFLLAYDVVNSRKVFTRLGYMSAVVALRAFRDKINKNFSSHSATGLIGTGRTFSNFDIIIGDSGGGFFYDTSVIEPIILMAEETLPFKLRWAVGADGWDEKIREICG